MATTSASLDGSPRDEPHSVYSIGTAEELEEKKNGNQNKELFVYEFTSKDYQLPCTIMSKTFRKLSMDTKFKEATAFFEMDVDDFQDLAVKYKLDVYPAFLLLNPKDTDKEVGTRVTGVNPGKLESSIEEALNKLRMRAPVVRHPPVVPVLLPHPLVRANRSLEYQLLLDPRGRRRRAAYVYRRHYNRF